LVAKILVIALLTLALLLPLRGVESLIAERTALRDSAVAHLHGAISVGAHVGRFGSLDAVCNARRGIVGLLPGIDGPQRASEFRRIVCAGGLGDDALAVGLFQRCTEVPCGGIGDRRFGRRLSLLYLLVLSQDYALLFGALAIFLLLATTMIGTRKLDWHRVAESRKQ